MGQTALIPAWVVPTAREVADCHWIVHAYAEQSGPGSRYATMLRVLDWVTTELPDTREAEDTLRELRDPAAADTLAWLLLGVVPPITLPRRNPDGTVVTDEQLYTEYLGCDPNPIREQRDAARDKARRDAAQYRRLAALVQH